MGEMRDLSKKNMEKVDQFVDAFPFPQKGTCSRDFSLLVFGGFGNLQFFRTLYFCKRVSSQSVKHSLDPSAHGTGQSLSCSKEGTQ